MTAEGTTVSAGEVRPILWRDGGLYLLEQRLLPGVETEIECRDAAETAAAIRAMVVRGAPAIGVTAAYGLVLAARTFRPGNYAEDFETAAATLLASRPTAVNLFWAVERMRALLDALQGDASVDAIAGAFEREAVRMHQEDIVVNRRIGRFGAELVRSGGPGGVITHCNAGALATAGYGTAVGVIRAAWEAGGDFDVYATETRPYLQGARLTSWEFLKLGIPVTLLTDSMVGSLFSSTEMSAVVVGTDRTAANGDVANKIGTYQIAVLAKRHGVPFYVAAPTSSIDLECSDGRQIPIEERPAEEVTHFRGTRVAPENVSVFNPAFDVTPAELVSGIITEEGVVRENYKEGLAAAVLAAAQKRSSD
jgi:methylthioribose-1-phosphate isomerase